MKHDSSVLLLLLSFFFTSAAGWLNAPLRRERSTLITSRRAISQRVSSVEIDRPDDNARTTKTIKKKASVELPESTALFWHNTSDPTIFHYQNDTLIGLQFRIRGNPLPLQRHRQTRRGFVYNPSSSAQTLFREALEAQLGNNKHRPLLGEAPLHMSCQFHMKRSLSDFVANTRGRPLKKSKIQTQWSTTPRTPDVDNLAKFVLDSFNGLLYADDQQIVSLSVMKQRDNQGDCLGYTDIQLSILTDMLQ